LSSRYPFPWKTSLHLLRDTILLRPRSFRDDALNSSLLLPQQPVIINNNNIPAKGPCLLVVNHYNQPDFGAWWIALGVTIAVPIDIHWLMTAAWTFPKDPLLRPFTPLTYWIFTRIARVYEFTNMPPMPPDPNQTENRAVSIRRALRYARRSVDPVIAMAPEGRDLPGGILGPPPPGVGRFIAHLVKRCHRIVPIGIYEEGGRLCLSFGPAFEPGPPPGDTSDDLDNHVSRCVMDALALQLPARLRGVYGSRV